MCEDNPALSKNVNLCNKFAVFHLVFEIVCTILSFIFAGIALVIGALLCIIGSSILVCKCDVTKCGYQAYFVLSTISVVLAFAQFIWYCVAAAAGDPTFEQHAFFVAAMTIIIMFSLFALAVRVLAARMGFLALRDVQSGVLGSHLVSQGIPVGQPVAGGVYVGVPTMQ